MLNAPLRIMIVAALCVLGLIGLVVRETAARADSTSVLLAMEAVDPRSLLSGHYVIINLTERLPEDQDCVHAPATEAEEDLQPENRWIALRSDGEVHRQSGVAPTREEALALGPIAVKGTSFCNAAIRAPDGMLIQAASVRLDLGIDRFYINQADAERVDRVLRETTGEGPTTVFAIVNIGRDGHARLKGLSVNGEIIELNWF
jgi:uncharacterized membrane-anchored protein